MKGTSMKTKATIKVVMLVLLAGTTASFAYYNPSTGRWLSRDPIGEMGGPNQSGFVLEDPLNLVDLFGLGDGNPVPPIVISGPLPPIGGYPPGPLPPIGGYPPGPFPPIGSPGPGPTRPVPPESPFWPPIIVPPDGKPTGSSGTGTQTGVPTRPLPPPPTSRRHSG